MVTMEKAVKMRKPKLLEMVKAEARKARKRYSRLLKAEGIFISPALAKAKKSKPKDQQALFEVKGKSRQELLQEYKRIKEFMENETSTVKGTRKFYKEAAQAISAEMESEAQPEDLDKMFKVLSELKEKESWVTNITYKYEVFQAINAQIALNNKATVSDITARVEPMLDSIYKANLVDAPETFDRFIAMAEEEDEEEE